jgi:hypothetical protein
MCANTHTEVTTLIKLMSNNWHLIPPHKRIYAYISRILAFSPQPGLILMTNDLEPKYRKTQATMIMNLPDQPVTNTHQTEIATIAL